MIWYKIIPIDDATCVLISNRNTFAGHHKCKIKDCKKLFISHDLHISIPISASRCPESFMELLLKNQMMQPKKSEKIQHLFFNANQMLQGAEHMQRNH